MYRSRFWTMRQYAGFATAAETNERFRYLLGAGPDRPVGRLRPADPDGLRLATPPRRRARSAGSGSRSRSLADMEVLFAGIPLGEVSTSMTINATAPILLALYVAAAEKQGVDAVDGLAAPPRTTSSRSTSPAGRGSTRRGPSMRLVTDVFEFAARELPRWNTISISGYHMREAGATAAQELAFTLADGIAYVEAAVARGPRGRRLRPPAVVLLRRLVRAVRGGRQVPGRPPDVGPDHARSLRRIERPFDDVPVPHADGRLVADRPVDRQQRRPDHDPGPRGRARRHPEPAHELARRGARAADRRGGPPRPAHPADHRPRGRRDRDARPARRAAGSSSR